MESKVLSLFVMSIMAILLISGVNGETVEDSKDVDIDSYIVIDIQFSSGDSLKLDADISSSNDQISVFLIKGEEDFNEWKDTEEIDIQAILAGENVSGENDQFTVIENFSSKNVSSFSPSISIGDKDTYYLVIVIYREEGMSKEDILSRGSRVTYTVSWEEEEKELNVWMLIIAAIIGLIGIGLIVYYFKDRAQREDDGSEQDLEDRSNEPVRNRRVDPEGPRQRRRAPPMK